MLPLHLITNYNKGLDDLLRVINRFGLKSMGKL